MKQRLVINPEDDREVIRAALSKVDWRSPVMVVCPGHPDVTIQRQMGKVVPDNGPCYLHEMLHKYR